ncbi:hypothetical protein SB767_34245, partial [Bacillus sp. SIMBA_069]
TVSLVDERLGSGSDFAAMDFPTRNLYRSAIEELARDSSLTELEITGQVLETARRAAAVAVEPEDRGRVADPGYHLIGDGRRA